MNSLELAQLGVGSQVTEAGDSDSKGPVPKGGSGVFKPLFLFQKPIGNHCIFAFHKTVGKSKKKKFFFFFFWLELHHNSVVTLVRNADWQSHTSLIKTTLT